METGRGSRQLVDSVEQIAANVVALHSMASGSSAERKFQRARVKNGKVFVVLETKNGFMFAPSRFCGYVENNLRHLDPGTYRHGSETNIAIRHILGEEIGSSEAAYENVDSAYISYCVRFSIVPSVHKMERRYWIIEERSRYPDELQPGFHEGAAKQVTVNKYERSPEARRACISHFGHACSVCDFDFGEQFGEFGQGFIHVHHLMPLHEIGEQYEVDPINDLRPVCPNCHAMLHRRKPPLTVEELSQIVKRKSA